MEDGRDSGADGGTEGAPLGSAPPEFCLLSQRGRSRLACGVFCSAFAVLLAFWLSVCLAGCLAVWLFGWLFFRLSPYSTQNQEKKKRGTPSTSTVSPLLCSAIFCMPSVPISHLQVYGITTKSVFMIGWGASSMILITYLILYWISCVRWSGMS